MKIKNLLLVAATALLAACAERDDFGTIDQNAGKISLSGEIDQQYITRANDQGFADGDQMGVYFVDYEGTQPGTLQASGNRGTNVCHTFDEANFRWESAYDVYWKDRTTHIDIYGYYPFSASNPDNVNAWSFMVQADQSTEAADGQLGGYEQSDLLWGKVADVAPTDQVIRLPLRHRMSSARVELTEGSGFVAGEFSALEKTMVVKNTRRNATVDLATGTVTATGGTENTGIVPYYYNNMYRCIVVPQTVAADQTLFAFNIGGLPYTFKKSEAFEFVAGKMHTFTIRIDKKTDSGQYQLTLIGESITAWENDDVSHDATMKEYVIINSSAGHLKDSIMAANKDYTKLRNLKITGEISEKDFYFMRDSMDMLQSLNLKEVRCVQGHFGNRTDNLGFNGDELEDDIIPEGAMNEKASLLRMVLPDRLKKIGERAFRQCSNLTGSVYVPEGVTHIGASAFLWDKALTGTLTLPSTLEYIGGGGAVDIHGAFNDCGFVCELKLPNNLRYIGPNAFQGNRGLYGELHLPVKLERLGNNAFASCVNLTGSLEIPQTLKILEETVFADCGFNGTLSLHDGVTSIATGAFRGCGFRGELTLPKNLTSINSEAFYGCDFSGELKLPKQLVTIGDKAFAYNWRLMGVLEIPDDVITIGAGAFAHCRSLEGVIFNEALENIRYEPSYYEDGGAFQGCYGIGSLVCKGSIPPYVQSGAFDGVAKDNFTLEVPESSLAQYQAAPGWSDFKRIAAHRELVCRPSIACAINTEAKRTLVLNAEGDWEVTSKPDWCELSQMSGSSKTELTLTIKQMAAGSATRTGEIVFTLKGKDYTHKCTVTQYDYQYGEDEIITLQKASRGNRGGINIVIVGDGYDAKDVSEGAYLADMQEEIEYFFGLEPYKSYRDYFNVYTAVAVSPESGIGTINTIRYARFETTFTGGVGLRADYDALFDYAKRMPTVSNDNIDQTLIIVVPNSTDYGGICQMWESGAAIAFCPKSTYGYPLDSRGVIQHEAGGHGFGKLADEYIYHNAFIDFCDCTCCPHDLNVRICKSYGWFDNIDLTSKMHEVTWSHLIFDERYSDIVDIFEGGYMHNRGVFRSEQNSCMNNDIPYYSTISRESIVRRIKQYAGEEFSFEDFAKNDSREAGSVTRALNTPWQGSSIRSYQHAPVIHKGSPVKK